MNDTGRGVSNIVGIILLVGLTVALVSVATVQLFEFGQGFKPGEEPSEIQFEQVNSSTVKVTVLDGGAESNLTVRGPSGETEILNATAGSTVLYGDTESSLASGETLIVIREIDGQSSVIASYKRP